MKGWFDIFGEDEGPAWNSYSNRTPVIGNVTLIIIFVIFCTLFAAFLIIFPGIRKERLTTFLTVTLSLFVGTAIQVGQYGSSWHTSTATIVSPYSIFTKQKMPAEIGGYIGLMHINITYKLIHDGIDDVGDFEYNERFWWTTPNEIADEFKDALRQGIPFPIISLAEYFSLNEEGFCWGLEYREAGYYASIMLWTSFASWLMMNLLLIVVPRYGAISMIFTGACMMFTNLIYWKLLPHKPLVAHVDGSILIFELGWNFWFIMIAGISCLLAGIVITALDMIYPHSFSTILEVDYDTPYDRHVIIEESFNTRRKESRRKVGRDSINRFMSQVSSKLANVNKDERQPSPSASGVVNRAYVSHSNSNLNQELSTASNWIYPFPPNSRRVL